jgi:ribosomal protein S18 acetylase RimI-like enzyme
MSAVEQSPREGLVWSGGTSARLRPWPHDPECAHIIISGSHETVDLPDPDTVNDWKHTARTWGYRSIRTSALPTPAAEILGASGFEPIQHLSLLSVAHPEPTRFDLPRDAKPRPLRRWTLGSGSPTIRALLDIDGSAFDAPWQLDEGALNDALRATGVSKIFVSRRDRAIDGFVLMGVTAKTGFLQRLAVHPGSRRSGTATRLVARSLEWAQKQGCSTTVVNTETNNHAALGLYHSLGFRAVEPGLVVMESSLA